MEQALNVPGTPLLGIQVAGTSGSPIYAMAESVVRSWALPRAARVVDIGGGAGVFSRRLLDQFDRVQLLDFEAAAGDTRIQAVHADLNQPWPSDARSYDALVCLEVIEHLENPRHVFREFSRLLRPGGRGFISTPNLLSLANKLCFLSRDQFQAFQESGYPAHITPVLPIDLIRMAVEVGLTEPAVVYTNDGRIPGATTVWQIFSRGLKGRLFSDNVGLSFRSPF